MVKLFQALLKTLRSIRLAFGFKVERVEILTRYEIGDARRGGANGREWYNIYEGESLAEEIFQAGSKVEHTRVEGADGGERGVREGFLEGEGPCVFMLLRRSSRRCASSIGDAILGTWLGSRHSCRLSLGSHAGMPRCSLLAIAKVYRNLSRLSDGKGSTAWGKPPRTCRHIRSRERD